MKYRLSQRAVREFERLPEAVQERFRKQADFLVADLRHRSLDAKKYDQTRGIWQARIDRSYRFYFVIEADTYFILRIIPHPKKRARL